LLRASACCGLPAYPHDQLDIWAHNFATNPNIGETVTVSDYGTLRALWGGKGAGLKRLCQEAGASEQEHDKLLAAYILLTRSIRNRDAHAYIPNVRDQHHSLVPDLFTEVFNCSFHGLRVAALRSTVGRRV
jgi:hypothetical protein